MTKEEATKLATKLSSLFPNTHINEMTLATWVECLLPLNVNAMRQSINEYALAPGKKFFPTPGEILEIYDRHEIKRRESQRQEERDDEMASYRKLFHEPVNKIPDDFRKQAVQLIRDVTSGACKFGDLEWNKRYKGIFPGYDPGTGGTYGAM